MLTAGCVGALMAMVCPGYVSARELPSGAQYVALGSSYASGPGLPDMVDGGCARSAHNYPHQVAASAGLELVDVTCAGATTANILRTPQSLAGGRTVPVQLDAVTERTRLVTVTIGGNDLGLAGSMIKASACGRLLASVPAFCESVAGAKARTRDDFDAVESSIIAVVSAIEERAPQATVLLVQYLPALDSSGTTCSALTMTAAQAADIRRTYDGLVDATARAANETGAKAIAAPNADAHSACAVAPWVNGLLDPLTAPGGLASAVGSVHPNLAGTTAVAHEIIARL
ncbi:SGNH/GDSL hydrolase family protein [Nocardia sp. NPDC058058]|uniref:SGNH/GDSL hydrolase family protein n=1 Tax=Nocardia sp. NPDC058058 TaxID=3346317 RepID=UPI0036DA7A92